MSLTSYRHINPATAVQTWEQPLMEATGVKDSEKLNWMSRLAAVKHHIDGSLNESEARLMESYGISTPEGSLGMGSVVMAGLTPGQSATSAFASQSYKKGSGDIPTAIMGMAMNVAAYALGFDLVTTIPVDMPSVTLQFIDAVYGGANLSVGSPIYLQAAVPTGFNFNALAYGHNIFFTEKDRGDGQAIYGKYIGKSLFTGKLIFKFEGTGDVATATGTTTYTADTTDVPVADVVTSWGVDGGHIIPAATANGFTATVAGSNVENFNFEPVSSVREHIFAASNNDGITKSAMGRAQLEQGTSNKIQLKLFSKTTEIKGIEILADITRIQLKDLKAYGQDGMAMLYKAAQNQLIQTINDDIIEKMSEQGVKNHVQMLVSQGLNLNLFVGAAGTTNKALTNFPSAKSFVDPEGVSQASAFGNVLNSETNSAAENQWTRQRRLYSTILAGSRIIGTTSRTGAGDVAVVNSQLGAALIDSRGFQAAPAENTIGSTGGNLVFLGTAGNVKVYENPKWTWDDTRIIIGRKGTDNDSGLKMLAYDLASTVEIVEPTSMAPKISVLSRYEVVPAGFYPEANYLTILCANDFGRWV